MTRGVVTLCSAILPPPNQTVNLKIRRILKTRSMAGAMLRGDEGGDGVDLDPPLLLAALAGKALFPGI